MRKLVVGTATCGVAAGAGKVLEHLRNVAADEGMNIELAETGCVGLCYNEPLVEVREGDSVELFAKVTPQIAEKLLRGNLDEETLSHRVRQGKAPDTDGVLTHQNRIALRRCGVIDPGSLDEYLATGGFEALRKCIKEMSPADVRKTVLDSGLRGRGGDRKSVV